MNLTLFKYDLVGLNKSDRMRFYYSLYGRNQEGILKRLKLIKFSETILLCPVQSEEELGIYLQSWKIKFISFPMLIPTRLKHILK
jgi:hypothetical protein